MRSRRGGIAAGMVLTADLAVGVGLRGVSPVEVITGRDPVSGAVYCGLIGLSAAMPWPLSGPSTREGGDPA